MSLTKQWERSLAIRPDDMVNSVAISDNAGLVAAGTWYHNYSRSPGPNPIGTYQVVLVDSNNNLKWTQQFNNCYQGVYTVAISGDGGVVAAGGWLTDIAGPGGIGLLRVYDTLGNDLFPQSPEVGDRVNSVALSRDGRVLVAGADKLYVLVRGGDGRFSDPAMVVQAPPDNPVNSVAIDPTGSWIVSCDLSGNVCLTTMADDTIAQTSTFTDAGTHFHSVAIASSSDYFVAGGHHFVYLFQKDASGVPQLLDKKDVGGSVRWVSIVANGGFVAAVSNGGTAGKLTTFFVEGNNLVQAWQKALDRKPNGTSMDAKGNFVAAADGFDADAEGGDFYLFDGMGSASGKFVTVKMNWPIAISADGSGIAAGSDDGKLYFFTP